MKMGRLADLVSPPTLPSSSRECLRDVNITVGCSRFHSKRPDSSSRVKRSSSQSSSRVKGSSLQAVDSSSSLDTVSFSVPTDLTGYSAHHRDFVSGTLEIPVELADALLGNPSSQGLVRLLQEYPLSFLTRLEYLVEIVGVTKKEIVENLFLLTDDALTGCISPQVYEKREKLRPFRSNAEFCAHHFNISVDAFYSAAAQDLSLLEHLPDKLEKLTILFQFGYPAHAVLKDWSALNAVTAETLRTRVDMVKTLEEASGKFVREQCNDYCLLINRNKNFMTFILKLSGRWRRMDQLPPNILHRINRFATRLGVTPESVLEQADWRASVGAALFVNEAKIAQIVEMFADVGIKEEVMLENSRFFLFNANELKEAIETTTTLHRTDKLSRHHLCDVNKLIKQGSTLVQKPRFGRGAIRGVYAENSTIRKNRMILLQLGFCYSTLASNAGILKLSGNQIKEVLEEKSHFFARDIIAFASAEDQKRLVNLLQYYSERSGSKIRLDDVDDEEPKGEPEE